MQPCPECPHFVAGVCNATTVSSPGPCEDTCDIANRDEQVTALFERHHRRVVAWACRFSGDYETAKDLAQDVFVKAWSGWNQFRGESEFTTWLYTITRNRCRDYAKARLARPREVDDRALVSTPPAVHNDAVASLEAVHAARLVKRLMRDARLDPVEARAFTLHFAEELPLRAVTAQLGLTNASGARAHIVSATRKLRRSAARWQRRMAARMAPHEPDYIAPGIGR